MEVLIDWSIVDNYAIEVVRIITILMSIQNWKILHLYETKKINSIRHQKIKMSVYLFLFYLKKAMLNLKHHCWQILAALWGHILAYCQLSQLRLVAFFELQVSWHDSVLECSTATRQKLNVHLYWKDFAKQVLGGSKLTMQIPRLNPGVWIVSHAW